jgi:hypothetical protein
MKRGAFLLLVCFLSFVVQPVALHAAGGPACGSLLAAGEAEIAIDGRNWTAPGKSFPVGKDAKYKTRNGRLTFMLNDGTRIELGDYSVLHLSCSNGKTTAELEEGKLAIKASGNTPVTLTTPDALRVTISEKDSIAGAYFDGKKTQVVSIVGDLKIMEGATLKKIAAGESYIKENGSARIIRVQEGGAGTAAGGHQSLLGLLIPAGIVGAGITAGSINANSGGDGEEASPVLP